MKRKIFIIVAIILVLSLPNIAYASIHITNNIIADSLEKEVKDFPVPENTKIIDSVSIADKVVGNGNGMQYIGAILVETDLSLEQLFDHYSQYIDNLIINKIEEKNGEFYLYRRDYDFEKAESGKTYYCIESWDYNRTHWARDILDFDLRGH